MKCPNDQCHYFSNVNSDCCYTCGARDINLTSSPDEQETETRKEKWEMSASQREMKFRVWDRARKVMIPWDIICKANPSLQDMLSEEYTWLQFTGLLDKNGKKIYEGDVIRLNGDGNFIGAISWNKKKFGWDYAELSLAEIQPDDLLLEVIGNVYQNPELLKEAK